jgi:alpha-L-fucosidase
MTRISRTLFVAALSALLLSTATLRAAETKAERDARMKWWREAKFGMFIHWGVYSVPAGYYKGRPVGGIGEWIMCNGKIPMAEYQKYAKEFNPVKFDADQWVSIAKGAGMKYIVITSKHHDGFAMFDSKASDWNIVKASPFRRDPLKELATACRKQGIKLGFYYSQAQDWNNGGSECSGRWDGAQRHDMDDYIDKVAVPQVTELLTGYGEFPAVLWWDTDCDMNRARAAKLNDVLKLKPGIIVNNRLGGGFRGDTETPEQTIPPTGFKDRDWETCMTMNDTWGYKRDDHDWKPTKVLVRNLIDIASKGGNYLLNVGPTSEGLIPEASVERLREVGEWMKVNGEAIYGTSAGPFWRGLPWGRATQKSEKISGGDAIDRDGVCRVQWVDGTKLFLLVFDRPKDGKLVVPLSSKPVRVHFLATGHGLWWTSGESGLTIQLPADALDKVATVIELEFEGKPQLIEQRLRPAADGTMVLKATDAEIDGSAQLEAYDGVSSIGYWMDAKTTISWDVDVPSGEYNVEVCYAGDPSADGNQFKVVAGDQSVTGVIRATGAWSKFTTISVGKLNVPPGTKTISVVPRKVSGPVMNLRSIKLVKASDGK